jgi:hypothetical protein
VTASDGIGDDDADARSEGVSGVLRRWRDG